MQSDSGTPIEILLVDDDPGDVTLTRKAMEKAKIRINLKVSANGQDALAYLHRKPPYTESVRPDLILLDLNMPRMNGTEVLEQIRADAGLKTIPVVVLTTSNAKEDIAKSYELGANCFITKPVGLAEFAKVVKSIEQFWFTVVKLSTKAD